MWRFEIFSRSFYGIFSGWISSKKNEKKITQARKSHLLGTSLPIFNNVVHRRWPVCGARASWRFLNKNSSIMMQRSRAHHTSESPRKKRKQNRVDFSHEWKRNSGKEVEEIEIPGVSSLDVHEIGWTARKAQADECNWIFFFCEEEKKRKISTDVLGCGGCWFGWGEEMKTNSRYLKLRLIVRESEMESSWEAQE